MTVGIVGLGLIGGSCAKALKAYGAHTVYGMDRDKETEEKAVFQGAIDAPLTEALLPACEVLLIALCPKAAIETLTAIAGRLSKACIVVDLCGVKRAVNEAFLALSKECGFSYVGGHPMAGSERSGYDVARADLFSGAWMILTPPEAARDKVPVLEALFLSMGFGGVRLSTPEEHDRIIAFTSQLAHVLSNAYVKSPRALMHKGFSAGSFRDLTRVAYLNETMWTELFLDNSDYLAEEIEGLSARLLAYANALKAGDAEALSALLREGRQQKERLEENVL